MKIETPDSYEARSITGSVEIRKRENGGATIRGLAAVVDSLSDNLGGFREQLSADVFANTDMADVRGLFNHDSNYVLGRTTSKTVRLKTTKRGLEYEIDLPDTQTIRDLVLAPIERGDVNQSSFGFIVGPGNDSWSEDEEGRLIRTIHRINELFDVSPVTFPAYRDTSVGARSRDAFLEERKAMAEQAQAEFNERKTRGRLLDTIERKVQFPGL
jgi:HK97 family phage prohead protease